VKEERFSDQCIASQINIIDLNKTHTMTRAQTSQGEEKKMDFLKFNHFFHMKVRY